ncbi:MAG: metallophosphoesterase [Bacteroidetes bacterium]|jgi:uncharacterized protein|nr:metallophosphoesterase [Bacteroidota bacterium]MBT6685253.1 metallophosphoesterase [Bacteroidota bacterium]
MRIIIAISIFLIVLGSSGYYVYIRATQSFSGLFSSSKLIIIVYIFLMTSFFIGKIVENYSIGIISNSLVKIGAVAAGYLFYSLLFVVVFDLIRAANSIVPFYPSIVVNNYEKTKAIIGIISLVTITAIYVFGYINAQKLNVKELDISINKSESSFESLNVVAVSDIHLGISVNKKKTKRLIDKINHLKPDLVIIGGDIIDDNLELVKHFKLLEYFKNIESKYGVYSCMGNHEYISRSYKDLNYFEENGINILKDTTINIDNKFYIIGRDDKEGRAINGKERKSIAELSKNIDFKLPVILLDHQPFSLEKTAEYPIDLQFSGHTHNGQFWPLNYITGLIFEEDWGYLKKQNTHFYVSSGYGTAVVPIKVGNKSEIVNIRITNN